MKNSPLTLTLQADLPGVRLAELTRDLSRDLSRIGISAVPADARPEPGDRGGAVSVGEIIIALITSGAIKAAIDCLRAYLVRERSLALQLSFPNGRRLAITAKNLGTPEVVEALQSAVSTLGESRQAG